MSVPHVYQAINEITAKLAARGIAKDHKNQQQGYRFRGIDDIYNAVAPLLAEAGLCILPKVLSRVQVERTTAKGGALFYVTVQVEFTLVSTKDASTHVVSIFGEAMDSADKATNKAMSAAYKYACLQVFCIPTEGDDADETTHEVAPQKPGVETVGGFDVGIEPEPEPPPNPKEQAEDVCAAVGVNKKDVTAVARGWFGGKLPGDNHLYPPFFAELAAFCNRVGREAARAAILDNPYGLGRELRQNQKKEKAA